MILICGIILIEKTEIAIRIYEVNKTEWKLIHYQNFEMKFPHPSVTYQEEFANEISTVLANFLTTEHASYVAQWKTGARNVSKSTLNRVSASLGLEIENLSGIREQELLCKGLFTELW